MNPTTTQAALALLGLISVAQAASSEFVFTPSSSGRQLHDSNVKSSKPETSVFNMNADSHYTMEPVAGSAMAGMVIGFACTLVFFIYTTIRIVVDEYQRHKTYEQNIVDTEQELRDVYDSTATEFSEWKLDFAFEEVHPGQKRQAAE